MADHTYSVMSKRPRLGTEDLTSPTTNLGNIYIIIFYIS